MQLAACVHAVLPSGAVRNSKNAPAMTFIVHIFQCCARFATEENDIFFLLQNI